MIIPANPIIVSANVSNVKIDGEVVPGLEFIDYKIENSRVEGHLKVRSIYQPFEMLLTGPPKRKSFQMVIEFKKAGKSIMTFSFDECYVTSTNFSMDANGVYTSEYTFNGTRIRQRF